MTTCSSRRGRGVEFEGLASDEDILAYLPMAWVGDNIFSYAQSYLTGFCVNCPESAATVMTDLGRSVPPSTSRRPGSTRTC